MSGKKYSAVIIPVMLSFFAMGFVDLVGTATNYIKADFGLSDAFANLCTTMVFFWFLIVSIPTGALMNRIGRRKTTLLSLGVTALALLVPVFNYSAVSMILSFCLLGIGNAIMQVSLNPLVANIVSGDRLASTMTFGQFVKAIASFIAPLIASWGAAQFENWRVMFPIFAGVAVLAVACLGFTRIREEEYDSSGAGFKASFSLLRDKFILLSFFGIMCHVGIDVGTNVTAPKLLMESVGMSLNDAAFATSIYFLFRTIGCFSGSFILARWNSGKFFLLSVLCMVAAMVGLFTFSSMIPVYVCVGLIGFGNSNVFSIIFAKSLLKVPERQNAVSGLMIAGLIGGAVFPPVMGLFSDMLGTQLGAVAVMSAGVAYLLCMYFSLRKTYNE